ncbi:hypothetical protein H180DRAFT_03202 [Streptomyces sp. WMMB 322]|nr:hypothetical protein H180DRAFT_03202 [Streptomyces sp. WMMB 322]
MAARLLPETALTALGRWWARNEVMYPEGTPGAHTISYVPARWAQITPWPAGLAGRSHAGEAGVSRAQVALIVADALKRGIPREALIATYVWGKGKRGTPGGSGPSTLQRILTAENLDAALTASVTTLQERGAKEAYAVLHQAVPGLGPSFFTKFLYFTGQALPTVSDPAPLILDGRISRRLRSLASAIGRETGIDPDGSVAAWAWGDWNWSAHRYNVYLSYMHAATCQVASTGTWPSYTTPDLLECALFNGAWAT